MEYIAPTDQECPGGAKKETQLGRREESDDGDCHVIAIMCAATKTAPRQLPLFASTHIARLSALRLKSSARYLRGLHIGLIVQHTGESLTLREMDSQGEHTSPHVLEAHRAINEIIFLRLA